MKANLEVNLIENHEEWPEYKLGLNTRVFSEQRLFISSDGLIHILNFQLQFPVQSKIRHAGHFMETFNITKCKTAPDFHIWTYKPILSKAKEQVITVRCRECHHSEIIEIQRCEVCFPPKEDKE